MIMKLNINKIYILLITLFVSVPLSAQFRNDISYDDLYDSETTGALKTHIRSLSASHLEGRKAGTEGEVQLRHSPNGWQGEGAQIVR